MLEEQADGGSTGMTTLKIGIPPVVLEIPIADIKQLGDAIGRLLKRNDFTGYYYIIAKHSGKCLDVAGWTKDDCGAITQYSPHGGDNQQWILVRTPDGYYHIFSKHSGKCLDVEGSKEDDGMRVWQFTFHGGDNQKWKLRRTGGGHCAIIAKHSGKALDVYGWSMEDGANVGQFTFHGGDNQRWKLQPVKQRRT